MKAKTLEGTVHWQLVLASIRVKHDLGRVAEVYDMSTMQMVTLCSLEPDEKVAMSKLSHLLVCDASNITGIVERLVQRGLVTRSECENDRRIKVVALTTKGERLRRAAVADVLAHPPSSFGQLSYDEIEQLDYLLSKVLSH